MLAWLCYTRRAMRRILVSLLAVLVLLVAPRPVAAQKFLPKTIQFKGAPEYSDAELLAASGLKKGVTLSVDEMKNHLNRLMETGLFETLNYKFDGADLIYSMKPIEALYSVRFENLP